MTNPNLMTETLKSLRSQADAVRAQLESISVQLGLVTGLIEASMGEPEPPEEPPAGHHMGHKIQRIPTMTAPNRWICTEPGCSAGGEE